MCGLGFTELGALQDRQRRAPAHPISQIMPDAHDPALGARAHAGDAVEVVDDGARGLERVVGDRLDRDHLQLHLGCGRGVQLDEALVVGGAGRVLRDAGSLRRARSEHQQDQAE